MAAMHLPQDPSSIAVSADASRVLLRARLQQRARLETERAPMSHGQRSLWFLHQRAPASAAYNVAIAFRVLSPLDVPALHRACQRLVNRHAALRTTYAVRDNEPMQEVHGFVEIPLTIADASSWSPVELDGEVARRYREPFDLAVGPVCRVHLLRCGETDHVLLFMAHHIACDGLSMRLVLDDLEHLYRAETQPNRPAPPPCKATCTHVVERQRRWLAGPKGAAAEAYWRTQLAGAPPSLDVVPDKARPPAQTYRGGSSDFSLSPALANGLFALAKSEEVTAFTLLLTAFQVFLHRYTRQDDILVGTPVVGRSDADLAGVVGHFANTVALRARLNGDPPFRAALRQMKRVVREAVEHQDYPFPVLVEALRLERDASRTPVFQAFFNLLDAQAGDPALEILAGAYGTRRVTWADLDVETVPLRQQDGQFDLSLRLVRGRGSLTGTIQYNQDLFHHHTIERMVEHLRTLLQAIVDDPGRPVSALPLMSEAERHRIVKTWNETDAPYPRDTCLHRLIEQQVARTPEATAMVSGGVRLTYRQVNEKANALAVQLAREGIGPGDYVPVLMERSIEVPIAFLGIMKAGAAFAPLDVHWPRRRLERAMARIGSSVALVGEATPGDIDVPHARIRAAVDSLAGVPGNPAVEVSALSPIYLLHTSGSSGEPKGVINAHRGIVNRLAYMTKRYGLEPQDRILQTSSHLFDASVWQLFWPLTNGGSVIIPRSGRTLDLDEAIELIEKEHVTVTDFIPSIFDLVVKRLLDAPATARRLRSLRQLLIGGEVLSARSVSELKRLLPHVGITNTYGPTEASIGTVFFEVPADVEGRVPIGRPIDNVRCLILDDRLHAVPVGVPGTLYLGGDCVGLGYLRNESLTNEVFVPSPYPELGEGRLYNTGDLARYRPDGNLEFLGRADQQVKLHGVRIELVEIERALSGFPGIEQCAVVLRKDDDGPSRLTAYVVPRAGRELAASDMGQWLRGLLPAVMVPSAFVTLAALPRLATGKIDRLALPPVSPGEAGGPVLEPPRDRVEADLAEIWAAVLRLEQVGIHDNFFALGGSSLPCIDVVTRANRAGYDLTPDILFEHQTIAELAAVARNRSRIRSSKDPTTETVPPPAVCATHQSGPRSLAENEHESSAEAPARGTTIIESLGVYVPAQTATVRGVVEACRVPIRFPLEQMTGIDVMPRAGEGEFALELATRAIDDCLSRSSFEASDVDLLISCSISRCCGAKRFVFEPSLAATIARDGGFTNALAFDISNACAGMFTGLAVAQAFLQAGAAQCALVVSGEYISHLAETAQQEIDDRFMDPRLACLTLGDSGAALLVTRAEAPEVGFQALDLFTLGHYSDSCVAMATHQPHGGAIMFNQPLTAAEARNTPAAAHALETLADAGWNPSSAEHVILHQTSTLTLQDVMRHVNRTLHVRALHEGNTINNLARRGNTATTSHFVALMDNIRTGRIDTGEKIVFGISGSGQILGTALYTLDDLPARIRRPAARGRSGSAGRRHARSLDRPGRGTGVRIVATGTTPATHGRSVGYVDLARAAAARCLEAARQDRGSIDLVINASVYRKDFLSEPALASMLAGELDINATMASANGNRTLAFDLLNGSVGFLNACHAAVLMMQAGQAATALIATSEVENNASAFPNDLMGIEETGSAVLLRHEPRARRGFGRFLFKAFPEHHNSYTAIGMWRGGSPYLACSRSPHLQGQYLDACCLTIAELLRLEELDADRVGVVFPPQISGAFISALAHRLQMPRDRFADATAGRRDLFTSSIPYAFEHARDHGLVGPHDIGLMVTVGSGLQVGCALYYF